MASPGLIMVAAVSLLTGAASLPASAPAPAGGDGPVDRPVLVELFTSEGCSSCPPAEALLGELAQRPDVLALAFHVDYWDNLGWRDRFGIPEATPRQREYAHALGLSTVYTPQVIVDGTADRVGSDRGAILNIVQGNHMGLAVQIVSRDADLVITVGPGSRHAGDDITLFGFSRAATSEIGRGENSGRTLREYNIVRHVRILGRYDGSARTFDIAKRSLPRDVTDVAVIVQSRGPGAVLGIGRLAIR